MPYFSGQGHALLVDLGGHLVGADRQGRSHAVKAVLAGITERFFQPEAETDADSAAPRSGSRSRPRTAANHSRMS